MVPSARNTVAICHLSAPVMFNRHLLTTIASLLGLALLLWVAVFFEELRLSSSMQSQLQAKSDELDRQLSALSVLPRVLADHPDVKNALMEPNTDKLTLANEALHGAQLKSDSAFAFLMDTQGNTVASSNYLESVSFVWINYGFRPYFTGAMSNDEATFFAVGATTGIPGYFAANAVKDNGAIIGVVVVKSELAGLLDSWHQPPYHWLAVDELGVVILSTSDEFLYTPTVTLDEQTKKLIESDRRYIPSSDAKFVDEAPARLSYTANANNEMYLVKRQTIGAEQWDLQLIMERKRLWLNALLYVVAIAALFTVAALGYRNFRAQKRLADFEKKHADELELEVELRTAELRSVQEELISESNFAMLGRMSGAINHEINQPLASLRLNLASLRSLLDKPDADIDELRQIVVDSDRTTKRIGRVVTTLRSLAGQRRTDHMVLDANKIVHDVIETIKRERPVASHSLSVKLNKQSPSLQGNDVLLQQALLNLLYNAFDAVLEEQKPYVSIQILSSSQHIAFEIEDNGPGVKPELQDNLFKPFVSDKQRNGLGLGLTLAELIAQDHDGQLDYTPRVPKGSIFTLKIPVTKSAVSHV